MDQNAKTAEATTEVSRRPLRSKFPGKEIRRSFIFTRFASKKLDDRQGEFRVLSISDTVEQLIREHL